MRIHRQTTESCSSSSGVVVVVDVIRAFTTAAYAFSKGAAAINLVGTVEEAFQLRERIPGSLIMGEVGGVKAEGFDLGNSPAALIEQDLTGRTMIQRTSAGTQGMVCSRRAEKLIAGSFPTSKATARSIRSLNPEEVTIVVTGAHSGADGDEDEAYFEYLSLLLRGEDPAVDPFLTRVRSSSWGKCFGKPEFPHFPAEDLDYCTKNAIFDFCMIVERVADRLVMGAA